MSLNEQNKAKSSQIASENQSLEELRQNIEKDRRALREREQQIEKAKKDTRRQIADLDASHEKEMTKIRQK